VGINVQVLATTVGAALLTGLLFGVVPALQSVRGISTSLSRGVPGWGRCVHARAGGAFVIAQMALTLMLLVGAGCSAKLRQVDDARARIRPRARARGAGQSAPGALWTTAQKLAFAQVVIDRAHALPGLRLPRSSTGSPLAVGAIGTIRGPTSRAA